MGFGFCNKGLFDSLQHFKHFLEGKTFKHLFVVFKLFGNDLVDDRHTQEKLGEIPKPFSFSVNTLLI